MNEIIMIQASYLGRVRIIRRHTSRDYFASDKSRQRLLNAISNRVNNGLAEIALDPRGLEMEV